MDKENISSIEEKQQSGEDNLNLQLNEIPTNIWLQFNTISVGLGENNQPIAVFDLVNLLRGLEKLGSLANDIDEIKIIDDKDKK